MRRRLMIDELGQGIISQTLRGGNQVSWTSPIAG